MWRGRSWLVPGLAACALFASGCGQKLYRAETTLEADGRVSRAVYQPADDTPADARQADVWSQVTYAAEISTAEMERLDPRSAGHRARQGALLLRRLGPVRVAGQVAQALRQAGAARAARRQAGGRLSARRLRLRRRAPLEGNADRHRHARRHAQEPAAVPGTGDPAGAQMPGIGTGARVRRRRRGPSGCATPARHCSSTLTDAFFEAGIRGELSPSDEVAVVAGRRLRPLRPVRCATRGPIARPGSRRRPTIAGVCRGRAARPSARRDGGEVPQSVIDDLLEWLEPGRSHAGQDSAARPARRPGTSRSSRNNSAASRRLKNCVTPLGARMLGLYRVEILGPPRRFHYTHGNAGLDRANQRSPAVQPANAMECSRPCRPIRSVIRCSAARWSSQEALQKELLGSQPLSLARRDARVRAAGRKRLRAARRAADVRQARTAWTHSVELRDKIAADRRRRASRSTRRSGC